MTDVTDVTAGRDVTDLTGRPVPSHGPLRQLADLARLSLRRYDGLIDLYERRGPVVPFGAGPCRAFYLLGPDANRFLFANSRLFTWRESFQSLVPVNGETALIVSDGAEHQRRRRLVTPAFHHRQIETYLRTIAAEADATLDTWQPGMRMDIYEEFRGAIRRSTIRSLFGTRLAADADLFGDSLQRMLEMIDRLPAIVSVHRRLGTPAWRRAMAARRRADERVYAEIARLRAEGRGRTAPGTAEAAPGTAVGAASEDSGRDDHNVLETLVHGRDEDGTGLTDAEARDQAVSLIAAGYETTSAALAWAVYTLRTAPGAWDRARAEVGDVLGDGPVTMSDLGRLTYLTGAVHEALRLYPPAVISVRVAAVEFTVAGVRVRRGDTLVYSPYVTHRLPEVWPDPLRFDPLRWDPEQPGYRRPAPHEFLPFGGGPHRCIGATLATTELTVMLARLLARASVELTPRRRVRLRGLTAVRPRGGVPARVTAVSGSVAAPVPSPT